MGSAVGDVVEDPVPDVAVGVAALAGLAGFDAFYRTSRDRLALQLAALTGDPAEAVDHVQ
ncbi:hypothetical protein [Jatrophihabitans sp.]|uniref:hypothetical protein n=1 Tax=Jatrophihabitans sp. TaxID=1932789 RepID=UPI0030C76902|nr:hypothetical protein [Jatrophihabitans sp.]